MRANKEQEGVRVWKENIVAMEVFVNKKKLGRSRLGLAKRRNEQE
jgi:hypothetical protein